VLTLIRMACLIQLICFHNQDEHAEEGKATEIQNGRKRKRAPLTGPPLKVFKVSTFGPWSSGSSSESEVKHNIHEMFILLKSKIKDSFIRQLIVNVAIRPKISNLIFYGLRILLFIPCYIVIRY